MPTKSTKPFTALDVLKIYYSQGVIPSATWAANLTAELSAVQDIRKCKTYRQVTIDQLSPEDQDTLRAFLIDIRNLDIVQSSHKAAVDEKTKQAVSAFLAGQQFELGGVEFRYQNKQLQAPAPVAAQAPSPQPEHKAVAANKSVTAEFLPVSDEAYDEDGDGYEIIDDDPDDELYDEVDDSGDDSAGSMSEMPAPVSTLADLQQQAADMNAANDSPVVA